jgi:hypothetical protein
VIYCLERVPVLIKTRPELAEVEPFKTVMSGDREAIARLPLRGKPIQPTFATRSATSGRDPACGRAIVRPGEPFYDPQEGECHWPVSSVAWRPSSQPMWSAIPA